MILAYRMVRLIEKHSQGLVNALQTKIIHSDRCSAYRNVPEGELAEVVGEIYQHLGEWLLGKTEADIRFRYEQIGGRRAAQNVPLSQVIWVIALVKENLWEYLRRIGQEEQVAEVFGELEILQLLEQFFDRAMYFAAVGYGQASSGADHCKTAAGGVN